MKGGIVIRPRTRNVLERRQALEKGIELLRQDAVLAGIGRDVHLHENVLRRLGPPLELSSRRVGLQFDAVMHVVGSSSIANTVSVTPGGVGVTQAANTVALHGITDSTTATAYSLGQQLVTRAWNLIVAVILVAAVFGWRGGKQLVGTSYRDAKGKVSELREQRRTRRDAASAE